MLRNRMIILALVSVLGNRTIASEIIELPFGAGATVISANGEAVVSVRGRTIWTESSGKTTTGLPYAYSVSSDGSVVVGIEEVIDNGTIVSRFPLIWRAGMGMERLSLLPGYDRGAFSYLQQNSLSDDGNVAVGTNFRGCLRCDPKGFIWTAENGTQELELPLFDNVKPLAHEAYSISGDGSTIFGRVYEYEEFGQTVFGDMWFIWDRETGQTTLFDLEDMSFFSWPLAISRSGEVIVGVVGSGSDRVAARWTDAQGLEVLGILPGRDTSDSTDVSADGEIVVGQSSSNDGSGGSAFIWDKHFGIRELKQVLAVEYELALPDGVYLEDYPTISANRRKLNASYRSGFGGGSVLIKLDWPIGPPTDDGDMNFDDVIDATDVDLQMEAIRQYPKATFHDLDFSGGVDHDDLNRLIKTTLNTWIGDANLDGQFNSGDMVGVFLAGEYEDGVDGNSGWAEGDWNADGDFTSRDLTVAFLDGGYELGLRPAAIAVPEPSIWTQVVAIFIASAGLRVSRRKPRS